MKKHIRTEHIRCKDCGHEFWSKYHCPPSIYARQIELYSDRGTDFTKSPQEIWDYLLLSKDKGVSS